MKDFKGKELTEVTEWNGKPRIMWVWDSEGDAVSVNFGKAKVCYIERGKVLGLSLNGEYSVLYKHCAEIEAEYRPFADVIEMNEWIENHYVIAPYELQVFAHIDLEHKYEGIVSTIQGVDIKRNGLYLKGFQFYTFKECLENWQFTTGDPFGVEVEK